MQVSAPNNIKIYNLSAGKSLPEVKPCKIILGYIYLMYIFHYFQWLSERKRKSLQKKNVGKNRQYK